MQRELRHARVLRILASRPRGLVHIAQVEIGRDDQVLRIGRFERMRVQMKRMPDRQPAQIAFARYSQSLGAQRVDAHAGQMARLALMVVRLARQSRRARQRLRIVAERIVFGIGECGFAMAILVGREPGTRLRVIVVGQMHRTGGQCMRHVELIDVLLVDMRALRRVITNRVVHVAVRMVRARRIGNHERVAVHEEGQPPLAPQPGEKRIVGLPHLPHIVARGIAPVQPCRGQPQFEGKAAIAPLLEHRVGDVHHAHVLENPAVPIPRGEPQPRPHGETIEHAPVVLARAGDACHETRDCALACAHVAQAAVAGHARHERAASVELNRDADFLTDQGLRGHELFRFPQR
ncbi:hypothetical protein WJ76_30845 [Burkholderia ubonensis]|nr:hypothetical protein WJ76_30845 [Burkholderia ubonensis]